MLNLYYEDYEKTLIPLLKELNIEDTNNYLTPNLFDLYNSVDIDARLRDLYKNYYLEYNNKVKLCYLFIAGNIHNSLIPNPSHTQSSVAGTTTRGFNTYLGAIKSSNNIFYALISQILGVLTVSPSTSINSIKIGRN